MGSPTTGVNEELQPVGRTHVGEAQVELSPKGETSHWSRSVSNPALRRKEQKQQCVMN